MGIGVVGYYKTMNTLEARQDGMNSYYMAKIYSRDTEQAQRPQEYCTHVYRLPKKSLQRLKVLENWGQFQQAQRTAGADSESTGWTEARSPTLTSPALPGDTHCLPFTDGMGHD